MKPIVLLPGLILATFAGCSNEETSNTDAGTGVAPAIAAPAEDTAEATMRSIMDGMKNGQPIVAWQALPDSFQTDVNELVQSFGNNMDAQTWGQVTGLLGTVHSMLDTKQEFILNNAQVSGAADPERTKKGVIHIAALLKSLLDSVGNLDGLKAFDGAKFLKGTGAEVAKEITALTELVPENSGAPLELSSFGDVKIETVESTDSTAKLKFVKANGEAEEKDFVKFEGKWLPKDMVADWDKNMAEAREGVAALPEKAGEMRMQVGGIAGMVGGMLAPMKNAETQDQFNSSIDGLMAGAGMFLGPMLGGGMQPSGGSGGPGSLGDSFGAEPSPAGAPAKKQELEPAGK